MAVGRASGAIGSMSSMLGGPWGIAIGAAVAAIGAYSTHVDNAAESTARLAKEQEEQAKATQLQIDAALKLSQTVLRPDAGAAQVENNRDLRAALAALEKSGVGGVGLRMQRNDILAAIAKNDEGAQEARFRDENARNLATIAAAESTFDDRGSKGRGLRVGNYGQALGRDEPRFAANLGALDAAQRGLDERKRMLDSASAAIKVSEQRAAAEVAIEKQQSDQKLMIKRQHEAAAAQLRKQYAEKDKKLDEEAPRRNEKMRAVGMEAFSAVGSSGIQALSKLAQGQKISGKQIVAMIGDQMVALGTKNLFEGLAMSANPLTPGLGGPLIAAALAEIAAGVGLGAASRSAMPRAGGGVGGGGGGGSSGGGQRFWNPGGGWSKGSAISPTAVTDNSKVSPNTPIIVNMPTVTSPSPEDAKRVQRAMDQAARNGKR